MSASQPLDLLLTREIKVIFGRWCGIYFIKKYGAAMRKTLFLVGVFLVLVLVGCSFRESSDKNKTAIDFTVAAKDSIPDEIVKTIDGKKSEEFAMSFTVDGYTYIAVGYGEQATGGYSIRVDEMYETDSSVGIHTTLVGPAAGEAVNKMATYPYIVVKIEATDKNVNFE